jgi:hypothetical protein
MRLEVQRSIYIQHEMVQAYLTMRNSSGQALIFGAASEFKGHLEIELLDSQGRKLKGSGAKVDLRGLILRAGTDQTIRVNLNKWVPITKKGSYQVRMFLSHPMLENEYQSNSIYFDVSPGEIYWSKKFGIPKIDAQSNDTPSPIRTYNLRALQDKADVYLFLFIEDDKKIYAIENIGMLLGRKHAACEVDFLNRLHILLPVSSKLFQYFVFDWNGEREVNKVYRSAKNIPVLFRNPQTGEVSVVGGEIAQRGIDYNK